MNPQTSVSKFSTVTKFQGFSLVEKKYIYTIFAFMYKSGIKIIFPTIKNKKIYVCNI